jgi:hypothetical protein
MYSKGGAFMAYESKILLASLAKIAAKAETAEEVYEAIAEIANIEGVILKPYHEIKQASKSAKEEN